MLDIQGLSIERGARYRIALPRLQLRAGEVRALVGESGCGKSTVLEMLGLILRPDAVARFRLGDDDLRARVAGGQHESLAQIRAQHLGFVLQSGALLPF